MMKLGALKQRPKYTRLGSAWSVELFGAICCGVMTTAFLGPVDPTGP